VQQAMARADHAAAASGAYKNTAANRHVHAAKIRPNSCFEWLTSSYKPMTHHKLKRRLPAAE